MNRRIFLTTTALAAGRAFSANDRISYGLIGSGGRGRGVSRVLQELGEPTDGRGGAKDEADRADRDAAPQRSSDSAGQGAGGFRNTWQDHDGQAAMELEYRAGTGQLAAAGQAGLEAVPRRSQAARPGA